MIDTSLTVHLEEDTAFCCHGCRQSSCIVADILQWKDTKTRRKLRDILVVRNVDGALKCDVNVVDGDGVVADVDEGLPCSSWHCCVWLTSFTHTEVLVRLKLVLRWYKQKISVASSI